MNISLRGLTICFMSIPIFFINGYGQEGPQAIKALDQIKIKDIKRHTEVLASDDYQGRKPGTKGGSLTTEYLVSELKKMEIEPGAPEDSYLQPITFKNTRYRAKINFENNSGKIILKAPDNILVQKEEDGEDHHKGNQMVIIGPDNKLDELAINLQDKFVLYFPTTFGPPLVKALLEMKDQGAKGVFLVHENLLMDMKIPWLAYVGAVWNLVTPMGIPGGNSVPTPITWINKESVQKLIKLIGYSYEELLDEIIDKNFKPFTVSLNIDCRFEKEESQFISNNVIGKIESNNSEFKDEYIVYTAHWDHLGINPSAGEDSIYNGALDNAGGTATLLSIIKAFKKVELKRSILFVFTTAEEMHMSGSLFFAENPVVPINSIIANINIDGVSMWGKAKDIYITGSGYSTIDEVASDVAKSLGRYTIPDPFPEQNFYLRSDHYPFALKGIPAFFASGGEDIDGKGKEQGKQLIEKYMENDYHQPSDEINPSLDFSGAKWDGEFFFLLGYRLSWEKNPPTWTDDCPFPQFKEKWLELQKIKN